MESALTIDPSHSDLLAIKKDLLEIIKILTDKLPLPVEDWEPKDDSNETKTSAEEKSNKTEVKEDPGMLEPAFYNNQRPSSL